MPKPERKRAGLVIRTGKKSHMERLSLVEGCSQQHGWEKAKRISSLNTPWFSCLPMAPPIRYTQQNPEGREPC